MNRTTGPNRKGGPKSEIEFSPHRAAVVRDLGAGLSVRDIALRYGFSKDQVQRFKRTHVAVALQKREQRRKVRDADVIGDRMESLLGLGEKMARSLDAALQDPDDPEKYTMDLRATEVDVIFEELVENGEGKMRSVRRRGLLSEILRRVPGEVVFLQSKREDLRRLMIDTNKSLTALLEAIAKVQGIVKAPGTISIDARRVVVNEASYAIMTELRAALSKLPAPLAEQAIEAVAVHFEKRSLEAGDGAVEVGAPD